MQDALNTIYQHVFPRLKKCIEKHNAAGNSLYDVLKDASFKSGLPDYETEAHRLIYLLRYSAAYISEYYLAFKKILETWFLASKPLSILTLGAGANLDGLAACLAIKDSGIKRDVCYQGIEKAEWPLDIKLGQKFSRIQKDISDFKVTDLKPDQEINIIPFPKILSEIEVDLVIEFFKSGILDRLGRKICILFSNRNANNETARKNEELKVSEIAAYLATSHPSFVTVAKHHFDAKSSEFNEIQIHDLPEIPFSSCPLNAEIINICYDPGQFCIKAEECEDRKLYYNYSTGFLNSRCEKKIGRYPIKKAKYFDTYLYFLEQGK